MYSLDEDVRAWYKKIPCSNISILKIFHIEFNHYCKRLYPPNTLFEYCCTHFIVANIRELNDHARDVCESPFQENIYSHQKAVPSDQERKEGKIIELQINC